MLKRQIYYIIKPLIPKYIQILVRRYFILKQVKKRSHIWPIDPQASIPPKKWKGWPHKKDFALILTHDVDTAKGIENCCTLANLEKEMGLCSSFNFVPERYYHPSELREHLKLKGFEVGVHGLTHDGKLYSTRKLFLERAKAINKYLKEWKSVGFRSPAMHHNLDWIRDLDIEYDASTFDTDPFEPQPDGMSTIFPFWVAPDRGRPGYVELPYTLPQDFTLFILMNMKNCDTWKKKLDWIAEHGGMALMNTHPDYMAFNNKRPGIEEYPIEYYKGFLEYILEKYDKRFWNVPPADLATFWKNSMVNA